MAGAPPPAASAEGGDAATARGDVDAVCGSGAADGGGATDSGACGQRGSGSGTAAAGSGIAGGGIAGGGIAGGVVGAGAAVGRGDVKMLGGLRRPCKMMRDECAMRLPCIYHAYTMRTPCTGGAGLPARREGFGRHDGADADARVEVHAHERLDGLLEQLQRAHLGRVGG